MRLPYAHLDAPICSGLLDQPLVGGLVVAQFENLLICCVDPKTFETRFLPARLDRGYFQALVLPDERGRAFGVFISGVAENLSAQSQAPYFSYAG